MTHDDGTVDTLVFSPNESGKNRYKLNGTSCTGVTTILNKENKPQILDWAVKLAYEDAKGKSVSEINKIIEEKNWASKRKSESAMDIGTIAHAWVEDYAKASIENKPTPPLPEDKQLHQILQPFVDWCNGRVPVSTKKNSYDKNSVAIAPMNHIKFLQSEQSVVSKKLFTAGTYDLLIEIDGKKYIADFKTSSGIYGRSYFAQMAAYHAMWNEMGYDKDIVGTIVIRSGKDGKDFEVQCSYTPEKDYKYFLGLYTVYKMGDVENNETENLYSKSELQKLYKEYCKEKLNDKSFYELTPKHQLEQAVKTRHLSFLGGSNFIDSLD